MTETTETEAIKICVICRLRDMGQRQDGRGVCACVETWGHTLVNAHRDREALEKHLASGKMTGGREILPFTVQAVSGQRFKVKGGATLTSGADVILLNDVEVDDLDDKACGPVFEAIEIRHAQIAWVGFNIP